MSKQVCCWRSKKTPSGLSKFAVILGVVAVLALSVPVGVYLQAHVLGPFLAQNDFTCTDSDGGSDYFIKGTAKESASPEMDYIDQCGPGSSQIPSGHELIEWNCGDNNRVINEYYNCSNGCKNGACVEEPESTVSEPEQPSTDDAVRPAPDYDTTTTVSPEQPTEEKFDFDEGKQEMNWQDINQLNEQKKNELRDMKNREREYKDMQRQLQKAIKQGGESAVPASIKEKVEDFGKAISEFRACVEKAATFQDMDDCRFDIRQPRIEDAASDVWDSLRSVEQLGQSIREIKNFERECKNIAKEVGRSLKEAKRADFSAENLAELEKKLNVITEGCNSAVNKAKELINAGQAEEAWETIDEEFHYGMQDRWEAFKTIRQESIEPLMMCRPIKQGLKDMERGLKDIAKQTDRLKREGKNTASLEEIINKANSIREQAVQLIEKGDCEQAGEILQSAEYLRGAFEREFARLIGLGPILHKRSEEDINQQKELSRQFIDEEFGESKDFQEEIKNRMADMMAQMEKEILNRVMVTVQKVAQETMARLVESAGRVGKTNSVKQLLEYTAKANIEDTKVNQLAQEKADLLNTLAEQKNELEQLRGKNKSLASRVEEIENLAADRTYYGQEAKTLYEQALDITSEGDVEAGKAKLDEAYEKSLNALSKENVIAFTDTPLEEWFSGFVKEAKDEGYVSGKADSTGNIVGYDPGGNVLITEMVKMALEAFDKGEADIETSAPKVAPWAKRYIKKAEELGLNVAENRYRDFNAPATRAEIIRTIIETGGFGTTEPTGVFKDVPKTHPYAPFVEKAYQLGIVGGNPDGTFAPDKSVNRAEVAKIITNALEATKSLAK